MGAEVWLLRAHRLRFQCFPTRVPKSDLRLVIPKQNALSGNINPSLPNGMSIWPSAPDRISLFYRTRYPRVCLAAQASDFLDSFVLATSAGMCFDKACQESMDRIFLAVVGLPLLALLITIVWTYQPYKEDVTRGRKAFSDPETGVVFEGEPGVSPERDRKGELAYRVVSYTPWPVEAGAPGDRLRINIGPVGQRVPRTFIFERLLRQPSEIIAVTLPRPFGIVFKEDKRLQRVLVDSLIEGSVAEKLAKENAILIACGVPDCPTG
eukprot:jgi/Botrbrau1/11702/Bobra.0195s0033.2